ncbi:carboxypeptidase-like regulatory domain-containing protein [Gracilimonas sp.]|uniref:TonB-dependent receptor n=1 Tax=Gracilimonas sp. TaxID=1974203 RepID=UPI0032F019B0
MLALFSLNLTVTAQNQNTTIVQAVVISEVDGSPLIGANVIIYDIEKEEILYNCVTNTDGFCEIRKVITGRSYQLEISYIGYELFQKRINVVQGFRENIRVSLKQKAGELDEVTVEGQRLARSGQAGIRRVSDIDIARVPTPGVDGDLGSYLQVEPGVITTGDRGGDLFVRGGTPVQNQILVDNLLIVKPFHISNLYSAFSEEIVQNVDMYAGGFGAEYSGITSAVIDINLRPGNMKRFGASGSVSPYLTSILVEGPLVKDQQSLLVMARKSTIESISPELIGESVPLRFSDVLGRYTLQLQNALCSVTGVYTQDEGEIVPYNEVRHSWSNKVIGTRCFGFDPNFEYPIEFTAGYTSYTNQEGTEENVERYSEVNQFYMNTDFQQELFGVLFNYGFGINFRSYEVELDEKFTSIAEIDYLSPTVNLFFSGDWDPNKYISIKPGIASQASLDTPFSFEPRFRASFRPDGTDSQELSLALGRYVQLTTGVSDQRDVGSVFTIIRPAERGDPLQTSDHAIFGYQQRWGKSFVANIEAYTKGGRNIPVSTWTPVARIALQTALANSSSYGFDVRVKYAKSAFYASLGYGWSKIKYEADSGDLGAWVNETIFSYSPAHDQRHKLNAIFSYKIAGFTTNLRWELGSGQPFTRVFGYDLAVRVPFQDVTENTGIGNVYYTRPFGARLPYYHRLDVSVNRSFEFDDWFIESEIGIINAYDRDNIFSFDLNTLQRVNQTPLLPYLSIKTGID